jgi:hypothetical protein
MCLLSAQNREQFAANETWLQWSEQMVDMIAKIRKGERVELTVRYAGDNELSEDVKRYRELMFRLRSRNEL